MDMNIEGLEPGFFTDLEESAGDGSAGAVNQNIEAPKTGNGFGYGAFTILGDACIGLYIKSTGDILRRGDLPRFG
jgi:hypothetical protein